MLVINKNDLGKKYPLIFRGTEGNVYKYNDDIAMKIITMYRGLEEIYLRRLKRKAAKVEEFMKMSIEGCNLPRGLVSYDGEEVSGCYSKLIWTKKDFNILKQIRDRRIALEYLIKGDEVLQRIHSNGIIVGDVKPDNIMIDENGNPIFVDADNFKFGKYGFDSVPDRAGCFYGCYGKDTALRDNDIFVYTLMCLELLTGSDEFDCFQPHEIFTEGLNKLYLSKEVKEGFKEILSDSLNKPYVGPVLKKML